MVDADPFSRLEEVLSSWIKEDPRTAVEIATAAGLSESQLSTYRSGKVSPSLLTLGKILGALGKSLTDLDRALARLHGREINLRAEAIAEYLPLGEAEVRRIAAEEIRKYEEQRRSGDSTLE